MRRPEAHFGAQTGQCEVSLGHTRALAVASCAVVEPTPHRPHDGFLTFHTVLSPAADFAFTQLGRYSEEAAALSRIIERTLRGSRAVDTEALCILAGRSVWSLRVDVTVLDHDGNVADCAVLAALLALLHLRRPSITIDGDRVIVHPSEAREPVPLSVNHVPICISYALFEGGKILVADPTLEEEACSSGHVIIGMNMHKEICLLDYPGGLPISARVFRQLPLVALDKVQAITQFIEKALQDDRERRRTEALPVYARKFYEARRQQQQQLQPPPETPQGPQQEPEGGAAKDSSAISAALATDDPFLGFVGRLARARAAKAQALPEGEAMAVDDGGGAEGSGEEDEESHTHDANATVGGAEHNGVIQQDGDKRIPNGAAVIEETDVHAELRQTHVTAHGVETITVVQHQKKRRKRPSAAPADGSIPDPPA